MQHACVHKLDNNQITDFGTLADFDLHLYKITINDMVHGCAITFHESQSPVIHHIKCICFH